jgi:hypothetical protein
MSTRNAKKFKDFLIQKVLSEKIKMARASYAS